MEAFGLLSLVAFGGWYFATGSSRNVAKVRWLGFPFLVYRMSYNHLGKLLSLIQT